MKKWILLAIAVLVLSSLSQEVLARETVTMATGKWHPYISQTYDHYGPLPHIITLAFASEGIDVHYQFFPWKRAVMTASKGNLDAVAVLVRTPEREKDLMFSDTVLKGDRVFFHLKTYEFDWNTIQDLEGLAIGGTLEYVYGRDFQKAEADKRISVERVATDRQNFTKLFMGRIHIFPIAREVGYHILRTRFPPQARQSVTHHPLPVTSSEFRIGFSKKRHGTRQRMAAFNRGLAQLRRSGRYEDIMAAALKGESPKD